MDISNCVEIRVLFFAKSRELCGKSEANIKVQAKISGKELLKKVVENFPRLSAIQDNLLLSLEQEYIDKDPLLELVGQEELAIIPPISGG